MKRWQKIVTALMYVFLYAPILVLIVMSFNTSRNTVVMEGFTLKWYQELLHSELIGLLGNTLILAVLASVLSTLLGTMAAVGINRIKGKLRSLVMTVTNIPMSNPEIVTGISLALLFTFFGTLIRHKEILGFGTLLIAHITFCLPYVILSVLPKLRQMDHNLTDAALDLGGAPLERFAKGTLPQSRPGMISGMTMAFTMSLDDFVISYFVYGPNFSTLPIEIYAYTKKPMPPTVYALFTVLFVCILLLLILQNVLQARDEKKKAAKYA